MPKYDGNPKRLNYYIREVENLLSLLDAADREHPALICLIKSRLSDTAIDAVAYDSELDSWSSIKNALIRRLREPRNEIQVMQELTRTRRQRNEDADSFGKRLREFLDTLYSVGEHIDKSYYEKMVIEQYVNQLEFQVSLGVRIAKPETLELAIIAARQEENRLAFNRSTSLNMPSTSQAKPSQPQRPNATINNGHPRNLMGNLPRQPGYRNAYAPNTPQVNSFVPDQRQQWAQPVPSWARPASGNVRPNTSRNNSGVHRNQQNVPRQQVNPPTKSSDVTMRSVDKPTTPHYAPEALFYTPSNLNEMQLAQPCYDEGEYYNIYYQQMNSDSIEPEPSTNEAEVSYDQDFIQAADQSGQK